MSGGRRARWLVLAAAVLAAAHAATWLGSGPFDDDFICYRYAQNWVEGHGLVFNVGERFEGFTNPLWVMLIAFGMLVHLDPVVVSLTLSIAGAAIAAWAVGDAWRARYPDATWPAPAFVLAALPAFGWHAVTGLGTTLLAGLLALWFRSWDRARTEGRAPWAAGVWLALACLLRQECALFALPFAFAERRGNGRGPALLPFVSLAGWTIFRLVYYGRLLPIPYYVKKLPPAADLAYGLAYLGRGTIESGVGLLVLLAPFAARGLAGARRSLTRAAAAGVVLHTLYVVWVGGDFMALGRFFVPTLPLALLLAFSAVRERVHAPRARVGLALAALIAPQYLQTGWTFQGRPYRFIDHRFFEERWAAMGRFFGQAVAGDTKVALSPIGAFGYYSHLYILDILGLTNDASMGQPPALETVKMKGHHRFNGPWVMDQAPELVILGNGVRDPELDVLAVNPWEVTLLQDPRFQTYIHMRVPVPGGPSVDVFRRPDAPPPAGAVPVMRRRQ